MSNVPSCQVCGEGPCDLRKDSEVVAYRGHQSSVALQMHVCAHCGSEFADAQDALANKRAVMAFRKQVDGLLTGHEIRAIRVQYRISQAQAAALFGGGPVAFSKYENDDVAQSEAMDKLLRLTRASADAFVMLVDQAGLGAALGYSTRVVCDWKNSTTTTNVIPVDFVSTYCVGATTAVSMPVQYQAPKELRWN